MNFSVIILVYNQKVNFWSGSRLIWFLIWNRVMRRRCFRRVEDQLRWFLKEVTLDVERPGQQQRTLLLNTKFVVHCCYVWESPRAVGLISVSFHENKCLCCHSYFFALHFDRYRNQNTPLFCVLCFSIFLCSPLLFLCQSCIYVELWIAILAMFPDPQHVL